MRYSNSPEEIMRRIAIYDPDRVPRHWPELLGPGQFAVFLFDMYSNPLHDDFALESECSVPCCYIFDRLQEAKEYCEALVERREDVRCQVYDRRGKAAPPLYTIVNKRHEHRVGSKRTARYLMLGGVVSVVVTPPLFWYDSTTGWAAIWPTVLGINVVLMGARLLHWGYCSLEELRRLEQETAEITAGQAKDATE